MTYKLLFYYCINYIQCFDAQLDIYVICEANLSFVRILRYSGVGYFYYLFRVQDCRVILREFRVSKGFLLIKRRVGGNSDLGQISHSIF